MKLTELLCVTISIGLIAAFLLPALARAHDKAKRVADIVNGYQNRIDVFAEDDQQAWILDDFAGRWKPRLKQ